MRGRGKEYGTLKITGGHLTECIIVFKLTLKVVGVEFIQCTVLDFTVLKRVGDGGKSQVIVVPTP
jgi:hypothetical protein